MPRVSFSRSSRKPEPDEPQGTARRYVAKTDYGTRGSERNKKVIPFGKYRVTLYRRSDVENSSWFFRIHLREEGRHYRKSLKTTDFIEAKERAQTEVLDVLAKVRSGQRMLALSLRDLMRRFSLHQESLVKLDHLSPRTATAQDYRIRLGADFLKTVYPTGLDTKLSAIDGSVFDGYLKWRVEQVSAKREHGTIGLTVVRDELIVIRKMFKWAQDNRLCTERSIPVWRFAVDREGPKRRPITNKDFVNFLNVLKSWRMERSEPLQVYNANVLIAVVMLMTNSGLRSGEAFGLLNRDIEKQGKDTFVLTVRPETSKVRRARKVTVVTNFLSTWISTHQRHSEPDDFVLSPYHDGKKSARDIVYHAFKSLRARLKEIDLDWFDLYHCRHWWITNQLIANHNIHSVAKSAGTSTKEIESTYSHVLTQLETKRFSETKVVWKKDGSYDVVKQLEQLQGAIKLHIDPVSGTVSVEE